MANLSLKTGFTPVQTRVTLANNATTVVQNFAAYDAQELTGFVYVDATTDYRAAVKVTVFKNGAGTYEIAISDVAGDLLSGAPIVSFSISSAGVLSATLVSFAGYVTAYIQFNLNAPALGGQFPLQVDGTNVSLATSTVQGAYKAGQAPGSVSGTAIAAGFLGEMPGSTQRTGTNGNAYTIRSTTTYGTSPTTVCSATLNKGVYLVSAQSFATQNGTAQPVRAGLHIGGTLITNQPMQDIAASGRATITILSVPLIITTDGTAVEFKVENFTSGSVVSAANEMTVMRFA